MKPLPYWTLAELIAAHPDAAEVLLKHGVDPAQGVTSALSHYFAFGKLLALTCGADDARATLAEVEAVVAGVRPSGSPPVSPALAPKRQTKEKNGCQG